METKHKQTILLLNNGGGKAYLTPLLEEMLVECKRKLDNCFEIKIISLFEQFVDCKKNNIIGIIISGSSIIDLNDISEKGAATSWNISIIEMYPSAAIFGVCYGMQVLACMHGGSVIGRPSGFRKEDIHIYNNYKQCDLIKNILYKDEEESPERMTMHVSHRHHVTELSPKQPSYSIFQTDQNNDTMGIVSNLNGRLYIGVQYHIEAPSSQPVGMQMLLSFLKYVTQP